MKTLEIDDVKRYELLYEGLVSSGTKGAETRVLSKILTKLEEMGVKQETSVLYTLAQSGVIQLEDAEYELAKKLLNNIEWTGTAAKDAGAMLEWLENVR